MKKTEKKIGDSAIELIQGDITLQDTEAIANAANSALAGGGGVDGAIHRAAGPSVKQELKEKYLGCPTGSAVITRGGNLKARHIIHAVGPRYHAHPEDAALLASAYQKSLELTSSYHIQSISFPSISTGVYGYPLEEAAPIALKTVIVYLRDHPEIKLIRFVLFDSITYNAYVKAMETMNKE